MAANTTLKDYIAVFRRRRYPFLVPVVALFGLSLGLALFLPPVYEATATIQIEKKQIPADLIETTVVTGYIDEYLATLSQRVLSDKNLWQIAEDLDLYPESRNPDNKHATGVRIRRNISRETLYVDIGPDERRSESVAVAFTITYKAADGKTARDVANAVADLYLAESERSRAERAAQLTAFLESETERLDEKVIELETKVAAFKEEYAASLPEFSGLNMNMLTDTRNQLDRINETISSLTQRKIQIQGELAKLQPHTPISEMDRESLTPAQQLERLRLDYMKLSASYSPRHPDLARLRNELAALEGQAPKAGRILDLVRSVEQKRGQLLDAQERYSENHPDVRSLTREVNQLKGQLAQLGTAPDSGSGAVETADNPAYITMRSNLASVESQLESEIATRGKLRERLEEYNKRLMQSPGVEKKYRSLMRDYQSALREYEETRNKLLKAQVAERVERRQMGDRFTLMSPAALPDKPASPQRLAIAFLGFVLASGVGTGVAAAAEYFDTTVRGARSVMDALGAPPIATIPMILTMKERRRRVWELAAVGVAGLAMITILVAVGVEAMTG